MELEGGGLRRAEKTEQDHRALQRKRNVGVKPEKCSERQSRERARDLGRQEAPTVSSTAAQELTISS